MGIINFSDKYNKKPILIKPMLHVTNWRMLYEIEDIGILLVLANMEAYQIFNINFNELEYINRQGLSTDKVYNFHHNTLPCNRCWGVGKLDWIDTINGRGQIDSRRFKQLVHRYRRDVKSVNELPSSNLHHLYNLNNEQKLKKVYASQPSIKDGKENLCDNCKGTGIHTKMTMEKDQGV